MVENLVPIISSESHCMCVCMRVQVVCEADECLCVCGCHTYSGLVSPNCIAGCVRFHCL